MIKGLSLILGLVMSWTLVQAQLDWPAPPQANHPDMGDKQHRLDYVMIDVADWERYCAGNEFQTNQEIPALITYYTANNEKIFSSLAGIRLSGIFIRKLPQKSIAVEFSTGKYGSDRVYYPIWPTRSYDRVKGFVLRAHGNPMGKTFFKDAMINESVDEFTDLEYSAYRPVVVYINGQYQGLHNLREKKDRDFLRVLYDLSKGDVEVFDVDGGVNAEPNADWEEMIRYAETHDLSKKEHFDWMDERMEMDNFIDYNIAHMFYANTDWPKANVKVWRPKGGKWRWMFFDCDRGCNNITFNMIEHLTGQDQWAMLRGDTKVDDRLNKSTVLIRGLMTNTGFATQFARRYQDLLNTAFTEQRLDSLVQVCKDKIASEVSSHIEYWNPIENEFTYQKVESVNKWNQNINGMLNFLELRPGHQWKQLDEKFKLGGTERITIQNPNSAQGFMLINSIEMRSPSFSGLFFKNLNVDLKAYPVEGYEFSHWEGHSGKSHEITVSRDQLAAGIYPVFKPVKK
ncbi:MAG: CotH kinase family protein [Flavobacteriales bacterium]|nr:CotH kinase family protein [Flavobacteriales bacterium]